MKLDRILIILIVNAIFWSLINSVKNNKEKNELTRVEETSKDNDGIAMINAQIQKEKTLKPIPKIAKKVTTNHNEEKRRDYDRNYYQNYKEKIQERKRIYYKNNKEKLKECSQKYRENNKEKRREHDQKYYQNNREKLKESNRNYCQKNKEKRNESVRKYCQKNKEKKRESNRKYREKMKNKKENLKNVDPKERNIHSDNNEGTSSVRNDFRNKGKLPIVYEESIQHEERNLLNQEGEECNKDETETHMEEQNQTVVEEPTKINYINQTDSDEEDYLRYLNDKPYDEDEDNY